MSHPTKKYYEAIAKALADTCASSKTVIAVSYALAGTNELFDRARFVRAVEEYEHQELVPVLRKMKSNNPGPT